MKSVLKSLFKLSCMATLGLVYSATTQAQLSTSGYLRLGTGAGIKNQSDTCFGLAGPGLTYKLGNECNKYAGIGFKNELAVDRAQFTVSAGVKYAKGPTETGKEWDLSYAYVEAQGMDFLPEAQFWVGKRAVAGWDVLINGTKYTELDGTGAGVQNIDVGIGQLALTYLRRETTPFPGYSTASLLNAELKIDEINLGGSLRLLTSVVNSEEVNARNGQALTLQHVQQDFLKLGGYNTVWLQAAQGAAGLNGGFAKAYDNPWALRDNWVPTDFSEKTWTIRTTGKKSWRVADAMVWQAGKLSGMVAAHVQSDQDSGYKTSSRSFGGRLVYGVTQNVKLLAELGQSTKKPTGSDRQSLSKFTLATALSAGPGLWDQPELRLFYTHARWNAAAAKDMRNNLPAGGRSSGNRYGFEVEAKW
jgi:maltoporin